MKFHLDCLTNYEYFSLSPTNHQFVQFQAILMRRSSDHEGQGGLYTLKISPEAQEQRDCYTVAFEDRVDASNFCFLLESFFEDLGDFSADVVPLLVKVNTLT